MKDERLIQKNLFGNVKKFLKETFVLKKEWRANVKMISIFLFLFIVYLKSYQGVEHNKETFPRDVFCISIWVCSLAWFSAWCLIKFAYRSWNTLIMWYCVHGFLFLLFSVLLISCLTDSGSNYLIGPSVFLPLVSPLFFHSAFTFFWGIVVDFSFSEDPDLLRKSLIHTLVVSFFLIPLTAYLLIKF